MENEKPFLFFFVLLLSDVSIIYRKGNRGGKGLQVDIRIIRIN